MKIGSIIFLGTPDGRRPWKKIVVTAFVTGPEGYIIDGYEERDWVGIPFQRDVGGHLYKEPPLTPRDDGMEGGL